MASAPNSETAGRVSPLSVEKQERIAMKKDKPMAPTKEMSPAVSLSKKHLKAVNRRRRIIDLGGLIEPWGLGPKRWIDWRFSLVDKPGTQIDSLWWCIDEGNVAYYPSKVLPVQVVPSMKPWFDAGVDILRVMVE